MLYITESFCCVPETNTILQIKYTSRGHFPGCPVIKTLPSNAGRANSISGQGAKAETTM